MNAGEEMGGKRCRQCEAGTPPLAGGEIADRLAGLSGWELANGRLEKTFRFKNYFQTMAFVNATAWISHQEDHHPDLFVGYGSCRVSYLTHAIGGLSENDFICAARIAGLFTP